MHRCLAQTVLFLSGKLKYNILEVMNMRKMLKENKGFSLVELLVAILIMAVIAGTAITLFGGVLNSSRQSADEETAESIKRAILTYMNSTNDVNLTCLGFDSAAGESPAGTSTSISSAKLIDYLGLEITIPATGAPTFKKPANAPTTINVPSSGVTREASDIKGTYGPFLDLTKDMNPKTPGTTGWMIYIDRNMQVVTVKTTSTKDATDAMVYFTTGQS